jgi:hypothetical protein
VWRRAIEIRGIHKLWPYINDGMTQIEILNNWPLSRSKKSGIKKNNH